MEINKWTCRCAEHVRVCGTVEGTKDEVLGWTFLTEKFYEKDGERYAQYRLSDPDSAEAMSSSPLSACLGGTKYDPNHTFVTSDYHFRDWTHLDDKGREMI